MFRVLIGAAVQPLKLAFSLQRLTWSSPKGPGSLFDDDDNISMRPHTNQSGGKHHQSTSQVSRAAAQAADALAVGMSWKLGSASTMHYLSAQAVLTGREHYLSAPERYRLASDHR